ncbi:hypothetical protein SAMD00019534_116090 [Acytostelium subglobosum LB1]|uniref:hypothetical protein n=1 Tax=Acytostelium subglobosum LB1 TaxID=1410327 RepID=UPI0006450159|nr:hypothetical protein SAMD00019534_116090 [Acytostelium subglobosum LB1]GAM28433.1 hypothetical protein SAMD00019534_116090 [Acytostelium subglobosum LB1]|eukprot:XP_012748750.1 hypothetical protein SAMD00019534_116090 [Acytostelium subglobosum LB1]
MKSHIYNEIPSLLLSNSKRFDTMYAKLTDPEEHNFIFYYSSLKNLLQNNVDVNLLSEIHKQYGHYFKMDGTGWMMDECAKSGSLACIVFMHNLPQSKCTDAAMDYAAAAGHLNIVQFLSEHRTEGCTTHAIDLAALNGHARVVSYLIESRTEGFTPNGLVNGARSGSMEILKQMGANTRTHLRRGKLDDLMLDMVVYSGSLDIIKEFLSMFPGVRRTNTPIKIAAEAGYLDIVRYLHENGWPATTSAMDYAAGGGHMDVLRFLHDNRTEGFTQQAIAKASGLGFLDVVLYLLELDNQPPSGLCFENAALHGHLVVLHYLNTYTPQVNANLIGRVLQASRNNAAEVVMFLHQNGLSTLAPEHLIQAIRLGSLPLVRYIINAFPSSSWDHQHLYNVAYIYHQIDTADHLAELFGISLCYNLQTLNSATTRSDIDVLNEHLDHCPELVAKHTTQIWGIAVENDDPVPIQFLIDSKQNFLMDYRALCGNGCIRVLRHLLSTGRLRYDMSTYRAKASLPDEAASKGRLEVLQFLLWNGLCEFTSTDIMDSAAKGNHYEVVQFLHRYSKAGCTVAAMNWTTSLEILHFLRDHRTEGISADAFRHDHLRYRSNSTTRFGVLSFLVQHYPDLARQAMEDKNCSIEVSNQIKLMLPRK